METITIPKEEYELLKSQAQIYKIIASDFFKTIGNDNLKNLMSEFKETNLYSEDFLADLENGLSKSSLIVILPCSIPAFLCTMGLS